MDRNVVKLYRAERKLGWRASEALWNAKVRARWSNEGDLVRLRVEPDEDGLDYDSDPRDLKRAREEGVWGIVGEYRTSEEGEWQHGGSVWGFIGEDWRNSGYDVSVMHETLEALLDGFCAEISKYL